MTFDRDWTIAPGETLRDWADENGLPERVTAHVCGMWPSLYRGIVAGKVKITLPIADAMARGTGITARFWMNHERMYRADLAAGRSDQSRPEAST